MNKLMKLAASALLSVMLVSGCSSIPLSTMMRLSSMGPEAIATTNPSDIRVKFLVPEGFALNNDEATLVLRATDENDVTESVAMQLDVLSTEQEQRSAGLFRGNKTLTANTFKLTEASAEELFAMQESMHEGGSYDIHFSVGAPWAEIPPDADEVTFWLDLQLSPDEPYLRLFDGVTMKFDDTKTF